MCVFWGFFDDIINGRDINFSDILLHKNLYENILVCYILYKTSMCPKLLQIRFDKRHRFIRVCGGESRCLVLFAHELFQKICDKIKYLISEKGGIIIFRKFVIRLSIL